MNTIAELQQWCNAQLVQGSADRIISELSIDSRKINLPEEALFIALKTGKRNGLAFVHNAYTNGVKCFLLQEMPEQPLPNDVTILLVKNTLTALQQIAANHRKQYHIPVIGVTGSNGKTIVKEWLYQLLNGHYHALRSPKSYNSQIGVPLAVWLLEPECNIAVFEAGLSQPGEMENLEKIIQPTIGIFTNIGEAHSEGFLNIRQKIHEKLLLFKRVQQLIYCKDHLFLNESIVAFRNQMRDSETGDSLQLFTWSRKSNDAHLWVIKEQKHLRHTEITAIYKDKEIFISIPFTDAASIENAIHCWCALLLLGIAQDDISKGMNDLQPVAMRLELRHGVNDCTIINDTYNSDLTSLFIALEFLEQQRQHHHRTVILTDMLQVAASDTALYEEVAATINRKNIQRFIGIGPALYKNKASFRQYKKLRSIFFKSTEEFLKNFHLLTFENEAILLKGARAFTFEKINAVLEEELHRTVLSIDLHALRHNLNFYKSKVAPKVKMMAMVKAFSYGSGGHEIANLLQYEGADYLSVAYVDEGVTLRKAGITLPIMVMSPEANAFDRMIAWKLEPEIFNLRSLLTFLQIAEVLQVTDYPIHLKLDTGMHRLGFMHNELDAILPILINSKHVKVASIFSHLAASEDNAEDDFTEQQGKLFAIMSQKIIDYIGYKPLLHICNTAGILRHPYLHFDMVRLGLGLYGIDSAVKHQQDLLQSGTLKTIIAQIKEIPAGETIGYGRKGGGKDALSIATIAIGYADGYPRALGNGKAHVLIHGKPAPIIGVVCMDMCMVDISHIPEAAEGDEVIVFGPELPITQIAQWAATIPYEIMTGISQRVKRIYVNE